MFKILHHESFFSCKSLFFLPLYKGYVNGGKKKKRQNLTFCDPSINGSVHNSIYVCVGASMWKHRGLRDIKPFPLNIIWPYQSHSQKKAYVCIYWKKRTISLCSRKPTHSTLHSLWKCSTEVTLVQNLGEWQKSRRQQKNTNWVFWWGNKLNFWKNANAHLSINVHVGQLGCVSVIHSRNSWI